MAQEAAQDGRAQRWYLLGLRAARSASDPGLASSIMALMSNQAITLGKPHHALQLSEAAGKAAAQAPAVVQALIAARSTMAYANAGDRSGVEFGRARAAELINDADQISGDRPPWTSYVTATELDAICGRALIMLARHTSGQRRHTLINDAESLLRGRALDLSDTHRRSALRHSALLSRAYLRNGDLDQAVHTGHLALQRFPMVTSARCTSLLAALRTDLRPHAHRTSDIRDLVDELDKALPASRQRL
jgi:hypothetical protein